MKILDPGHMYHLNQLDTDKDPAYDIVELRFVKRIGDKFPGYAGTTTQEVLRALIDRTKYVDAQIPHVNNHVVLVNLRTALCWLEMRAAQERGDSESANKIMFEHEHIETLPTCEQCGHVMCDGSRH